MFLGASSFIPTRKTPKKEIKQPSATRTYLMFLESSIAGTSFEVASFPSSKSLLEAVPYLIHEDKLYQLCGIKPNMRPVSLFVGNKILNEEYFLATFRFDAIFIIISLLYIEPDKFISIPQRIFELYRGGLDESQGNGIAEAGAFALWNNNVDNIRERVTYLCDFVKQDDTSDAPLKPNNQRIMAMLTYKVKNFEAYAKSHNLMMAGYCKSKQTSESQVLRTHHVSYDSKKANTFAWSVVSNMLSDKARKCLSLSSAAVQEETTPVVYTAVAAPVIKTTNKVQKKRKTQAAVGTPSIMSFFKTGKSKN